MIVLESECGIPSAFQTSMVTFLFLWQKGQTAVLGLGEPCRGAFDSAKNHKRQRRKRQSVTAKREKSQTPKFV